MKNLALVFERLTFTKIIALWLAIVLSFSIIYFGLTYTDQHLIYDGRPLSNDASGFGNAVYFSFITATTIGYGDISPLGIAKVIAIIEAIFSMSIFGLFIAKIVSIKQEEILEEIEELSLEEASNKLITRLYLFRSDIKDIKQEIDKKSQEKKTKKDYRKELSYFEETEQELQQSIKIFNNTKLSQLTTKDEEHINHKEQTLMRIELISNSINFSLSKLVELLEKFDEKKIEWKKESITATIAESQKIQKTLYEQYTVIRSDEDISKKVEEKLEDLNKTLTTLQESLQTP